MMKKILTLCIGLLFMASCEDESTKNEPTYEIRVEHAKYTLDNQGKANISVTVTPEDFDISNLKISYSEFNQTMEDPNSPEVAIMSVTKDAQTSGKWTVAIGLKGKDKKPYAPKPQYNYKTSATANLCALRTSGEPVCTEVQYSLDIKSSL